MDTITLNSLQYRGKHGYFEQERDEGNNFEVDLLFRLDLSGAAATDNLNKTVDYRQAEQIVREVMYGPSLRLIETLTRHIGDRLFNSFPAVKEIEVRVRKMNPPLETRTRYSEVCMTWQR